MLPEQDAFLENLFRETVNDLILYGTAALQDGTRANDSEKYAYLDQLSTERLEALIRADIESPDNTNDEVIFHILEVMKKREQEHPTGRLVDVDEAWAEFQQHYN